MKIIYPIRNYVTEYGLSYSTIPSNNEELVLNCVKNDIFLNFTHHSLPKSRQHTSFSEAKEKSGGLKFYQTFTTPRMSKLDRTSVTPTSTMVEFYESHSSDCKKSPDRTMKEQMWIQKPMPKAKFGNKTFYWSF